MQRARISYIQEIYENIKIRMLKEYEMLSNAKIINAGASYETVI